MTKVSVIIPFFNAETSLHDAIESIACQSLKDFECLLINNNSTDLSVKIAEISCKKDKRFKLLHEKKQGVSYASIKGSKTAQSEFIARMDADDISFPDRLELQYQFLQSHPEFIAVSSQVEFGGNKCSAQGLNRYVEWVNSLSDSEQIFVKRFIESPVINPTAMWRKSFEEAHGGYLHGNFPEDYELWLRWISKGGKIGKINKKLIIWNDMAGRLTRTDDRYSTQAFYETKSQYLCEHLKKINTHFPNVYIWGASRIMRRRSEILLKYGIKIKGYIDITEKRILKTQIIHYTNIPSPTQAFILVYVPQVDIRNKIETFLTDKGFTEGKDFLFIA